MEALPILAFVALSALVKWLSVVAAVVVGIRIANRLPRRTA
jgi:hypothetical protein